MYLCTVVTVYNAMLMNVLKLASLTTKRSKYFKIKSLDSRKRFIFLTIADLCQELNKNGNENCINQAIYSDIYNTAHTESFV